MCGICGIYHYRTGQPADERLVRDMAQVIRHRGPDDDGFYMEGPLGLGMRRLSIIDLEGGAQPIAGEAGDVVTVFNGEIYNFRELRRELESHSHVFATRADTEVIVHGYEQWGFAALERLNGMFGIAVWDGRHETLVLARDPYGIKPLYYHDDGSTVRFGSEVRSILCDTAVSREVDLSALDQLLSFAYVPSPGTAFAGINKVPPGFALVCTPGGCSLRRFHVAVPDLIEGQNEGELIQRLRGLIETAIGRQMVADVPVGALLSGGVDSTTTVTIMSSLSERQIDTFTVGFTGDYELNEIEQARATAQRLGTTHHEILISAHEYAEFLPFSIWHLEEPAAMDSTLAYYRVCELARESVKVVLTGQGADEPFAGYDRHLGERYGWLYRGLPEFWRASVVSPLIERMPRGERMKRATRALGTRDPRQRMIAVWTLFDADLKRDLYREGVAPPDDSQAAGRLWERDVAHLDGLSQMLYMDARLSLADNLLLYGDKMAMATSLEARVPFLDLDLMRFVESLPPGLKIRGRTGKYILKRAAEKWVPSEIINRKKVPFRPPIDRWLRTELKTHLADVLLAEGSACAKYFLPGTVRRMIDDHAGGRQDYKRALLSLLVFELWYDQFIRPSAGRFRAALFAAPVAARREST